MYPSIFRISISVILTPPKAYFYQNISLPIFNNAYSQNILFIKHSFSLSNDDTHINKTQKNQIITKNRTTQQPAEPKNGYFISGIFWWVEFLKMDTRNWDPKWGFLKIAKIKMGLLGSKMRFFDKKWVFWGS